ncbi:MAG TPA: HD domain-containing protein [Microvirga sp.]|jgi:(p)ppGpp synthase/HD superfamily hydrolase|nr:HD domain-containing protein [Microvirga sp.]
MSTLERAIVIASEAHAGQTDKGGAPYILHPLRVMMTALETGGHEAAIAAVLHDVVEDCPAWPASRLAAEGFSPAVMSALDCLTKREGEDYMEFVERCRRDPIARIVKLADLKDNMNLGRISTPTPKDQARIETYKKAVSALQQG